MSYRFGRFDGIVLARQERDSEISCCIDEERRGSQKRFSEIFILASFSYHLLLGIMMFLGMIQGSH